MKKLFTLLFVFSVFANFTSAQLTERINDSTSYKLGNRPMKGAKVLTVGLNIKDTTFSNFKVGNSGIIIMGRYYITDRTALRASIRVNKDSRVTRGTEVDTTQTFSSAQTVHDVRVSNRQVAFMPGIERHFQYKNLFDIYFGGDAIAGYSRRITVVNDEYTSGAYVNESKKTPETFFGGSGLLGLNLFVGDLPLSIGLEYSATFLYKFGGKTHVEKETKDAVGNIKTEDYYTQEKDALNNPDPLSYSTLKRRSVDSYSSFRLTLNFYIK